MTIMFYFWINSAELSLMISLEGHSVVFDHEALGLGLVEGAHVGAGGLLEVDDVSLHRACEGHRLAVDDEVR